MRADLKKFGIVTVVTEVGTVNIVSENNKAVFLTPALYQRMMLEHSRELERLGDQILYQYDCLNKGIQEVKDGVSNINNKMEELKGENRGIKEQLTQNNKELSEIKQMMSLMLKNQMPEKHQQSNSFTSFVER